MSLKKGVICIDFGTSSFRAAIRDNFDNLKALEIGEIDKSQIDRASIPSAILITSKQDKIYFGSKAVEHALNDDTAFLYEISPKKWITDHLLDDFISGKSKLNKLNLLSGLLHHCLVCISKSMGISIEDLTRYEIRISHPVWEKKFALKHKNELEKILSNAFKIKSELLGVISTTQFLYQLDKNILIDNYSEQDTLEPVAAALELFSNTQNKLEFCVIVDVGAGTTDMAAFISATPSKDSVKRKLIQVSQPSSLYQAGDTLDEEILKIIQEKNKAISASSLADLSKRRRTIKESIFKLSKIYEGNVSVTISDLEKRSTIKSMCDQIHAHFMKIIDCSSKEITNLVNVRDFPINEITVIFAGGGSNIRMFHEALGKTVLIDKKELPISISNIKKRVDLPADHQRLAVSLGGTTHSRDWPTDSFVDQSKSHRAYFL